MRGIRQIILLIVVWSLLQCSWNVQESLLKCEHFLLEVQRETGNLELWEAAIRCRLQVVTGIDRRWSEFHWKEEYTVLFLSFFLSSFSVLFTSSFPWRSSWERLRFFVCTLYVARSSCKINSKTGGTDIGTQEIDSHTLKFQEKKFRHYNFL